MDWTPFINALLTTQTPLQPDLMLIRVARRLSWAIVLASLLLCLVGRRWQRRFQWGLLGLLLVWAFLPGPLSHAYWLGLAFQTPSLMSSVLGLGCLVRVLQTGTCRLSDPAQMRALFWAGLGGVLLGWLLLLDTFAVLPVSFYALGFSPGALGLAALLASVPWVVVGPRHPASVTSLLLGAVLLLYGVLRLPNGNLWNALLDPWLWVALQLGWLVRGSQWLSAAWRRARATRA